MLRTMQYRLQCNLPLAWPRWFKRVSRLLCRRLANIGSNFPMRRQ